MNSERPIASDFELIRHFLMTTPAQRTVCLRVWLRDDGSFDYDIHSVLAIQSKIIDVFSHEDLDREPEWPTLECLSREGWKYEYTYPYDECLIAYPVQGARSRLASADNLEMPNGFSMPVVCSWPESEDKTQLAPARATLETLIRNCRDRESQRNRHQGDNRFS